MLSQGIDEATGGGMGLALNDDDVGRIGQGQGDALIVDQVGEFLRAAAGAHVQLAVGPNVPQRHQVGAAIAPHGGQPDGTFPAQSGFDDSPTSRIASSHRALRQGLSLIHI